MALVPGGMLAGRIPSWEVDPWGRYLPGIVTAVGGTARTSPPEAATHAEPGWGVGSCSLPGATWKGAARRCRLWAVSEIGPVND